MALRGQLTRIVDDSWPRFAAGSGRIAIWELSGPAITRLVLGVGIAEGTGQDLPNLFWIVAKLLPCHRCYGLGWRPDLAEGAPFVWMLPLSAQHIRGLAVVEIPRSYRAAGGRLPR